MSGIPNKTLDAVEWLEKQARPRSILIVFEDYTTLITVMDLYRETISRLWGPNLDCSWWKLDSLSEPAFGDAAALCCARADLIIFSLHTESELSDAFKAWVDVEFSAHRETATSVLALFTGELPPTLASPPALGFLQDRVHSPGMRLLAHFPDPDSDPSRLSIGGLSDRANTMTVVLKDILSQTRGFPHGGINE